MRYSHRSGVAVASVLATLIALGGGQVVRGGEAEPREVSFEAFTEFCHHPSGPCLTDIDDSELTFTAQFEGAEVRFFDPYRSEEHGGTATWLLGLPSSGGTVRGTVTAGPANLFSVTDAGCDSTGGEIRWTRQGNVVSFEFDVPAVVPDAPEGWLCIFDFDLAALPRDKPAPSGTAPPTDAIGNPGPPRPEGPMALAIIAGLVAGVLMVDRPRRREKST